MAGIDRPRPLGSDVRNRLEQVLTSPEGAGAPPGDPRPLGDALSARLADELADPLAAALAGIDAPRPLRPGARRALTEALAQPRRFRALSAAAAALVVLAGAAIGIALSVQSGQQSQATGARARHTPTAAKAGSEDRTRAGSAAGGATAAPAAPGPLSGVTPQGAGGGSGPLAATAGVPVAVSGVQPTTGPAAGRNWVTITGTGFAGAGAVRFGGTPALSFVVVSATEIRAEAPPHPAGTVDVTVTGPAGASSPAPADHYTYRG
jgi:hypothetical protein